MPDTSTVFQAEIEAISHACQYTLANLKELNINYIKILTDSQAAIKALNKPRITSQSVLTALEYMETLALDVKHCQSMRAHTQSAHTHSYMLHACRPELASTET